MSDYSFFTAFQFHAELKSRPPRPGGLHEDLPRKKVRLLEPDLFGMAELCSKAYSVLSRRLR